MFLQHFQQVLFYVKSQLQPQAAQDKSSQLTYPSIGDNQVIFISSSEWVSVKLSTCPAVPEKYMPGWWNVSIHVISDSASDCNILYSKTSDCCKQLQLFQFNRTVLSTKYVYISIHKAEYTECTALSYKNSHFGNLHYDPVQSYRCTQKFCSNVMLLSSRINSVERGSILHCLQFKYICLVKIQEEPQQKQNNFNCLSFLYKLSVRICTEIWLGMYACILL